MSVYSWLSLRAKSYERIHYSKTCDVSSGAPVQLDVYNSISWVNQIVLASDAPVVYHITKIDVNVPQQFLD